MTNRLTPALFAALVSALTSLVAFVLLWQQNKPGILRDLPITLASLACGVAALASLGVMLIVVRTSRQRKVPGASRSDRSLRYRTAVEMAWADGKLNEAEKEQLGALELDLRVAGGRAEEIERAVMDGTREELVSWDPPPADEQWMDLVEECVGVVKDLDRHMNGFDSARQELADHVILSLAEGLERTGVELISDDEIFDSKRHEPANATARVAPGTPIAEILSPGFAVGRRVLRRAQVRVE
jgi:hypothetical protein